VSFSTQVQLHFDKTHVSMRMDVVDDFIMFISSAFNAHFFTVFLKIEVTPESRYAASSTVPV
jgi:hypothetical protein